jgi:hypothetical protein
VATLIDDTTVAIEIEPGQRLVLEARGWPVGKARVEITVDAAGRRLAGLDRRGRHRRTALVS